VTQPSFFLIGQGSRFTVEGKPYVNPKPLGEAPHLFKPKGVSFGASFQWKEAIK